MGSSFLKLVSVLTLLSSCQAPLSSVPAPSLPQPPQAEETWSLETLSGEGRFGYQEGNAESAKFYHPSSIIRMTDGSLVVLDRLNYRLRKVDPQTGETQLFWGSGERGNRDGNSEEGRFNDPFSLLLHSSGNILISDSQNHTLRQLTPEGLLTTLAGNNSEGFQDGLKTEAAFHWPADVVEDSDGTLYISDRFNHAIRKMTPDGQVTTLAGNGEAGYDDARGRAARFNQPMGLAIGPDGALYVADALNHVIRKVDRQSGEVTTYAGSGFEGSREDVRTRAEFRNPTSLAFDSKGHLLIVDRFNHRIREITEDENVQTLMGTGQAEYFAPGEHTSQGLSYPSDIVLDQEGNIYIVDYGNHAIRKIKRVTAE